MVIVALLSWWYRQGWADVARRSQRNIIRISHVFSLPILLRTLFSPWRRIVTYPGASIDAKVRAFGDNLVSRAIGFNVRLLVLLTAACALLVTAFSSVLAMLTWPLLPLTIPALLFKAAIG